MMCWRGWSPPRMSMTLGQPIVIENRGGAARRSAPAMSPRDADGYTLLMATSSLAIDPQLYPETAYDPVKDFAPIGLIPRARTLSW